MSRRPRRAIDAREKGVRKVVAAPILEPGGKLNPAKLPGSGIRDMTKPKSSAAKGDTAVVFKPFPNEHAARQADPGQFKTFRRGSLPGAPAGVHVIWGITAAGKSAIQSLRFDASKFTPEQAKKWLKEHNFKTGLEAATGKPKQAAAVSTDKRLYIPIVKVNAEEQTITGVVLQPEVVDAQGDIMSAEVIRKAAHRFLADHNRATKLGLMHKDFKPRFELFESYTAPVDLAIGDKVVKSGSWILTVHVLDKKVWDQVKGGKLTGFSIGGKAKVSKLNQPAA